MRGLVSKTTKDWDVKLAHAEFAYNRTPSSTTGSSPFEIVYGLNPFIPVALIDLPKEDQVHYDAAKRQEAFYKTCNRIKERIEKMNARYKERANAHRKQHVFKEGDLVWLNLRKERFPQQRKNKLMPRADGPFKVLKRFGDSAYKIELPDAYGGVSATFNVGDLAPYVDDENLRSNSFQERENDEDHEARRTTRSGRAYLATIYDKVPNYEPIEIVLDTLGFGLDSLGKSAFVTCVAWIEA